MSKALTPSLNLDFFAAESDQKAIINFLFSSTDVRVFESYSECGQELREFCSLNELESTFEIGKDKHGNGYAILLELWSPSVMKKLTIKRLALRPEKCGGHTFRYTMGGGGLIQLYLGGVYKKENVLTKSHLGHNSERRAWSWGFHAGANWDGLKALSNRIQYHIRRRLAVAIVPGRQVLPQAFEFAKSGFTLKEDAQTPWEYKLE